ncbi:MAG: fumarate reductase/succinate dehydrogenase flavoprotein subunit, partial [Bdellovibrio sp.]|nr:fumarate reductase/succinate dehydrogenase flavoprotein subunit [Bdellovibrio sp.]
AMSRTGPGLEKAMAEIKALKEEFHSDVKVTGSVHEFNTELDKANRLIDFLEMAELMCLDALTRNESCGAHFREEFQTADGEALRDDENFAYVSAWQFKNSGSFTLHKEILDFEFVKPSVRSYK